MTDILSFINQHVDLLQFNPDVTKKIPVTYHAPCHTRNTFKSHTIAEKLLLNLPTVIYKQTPDVDQCCGGGGTFFYEYPEVSKKMVDKKIESAKAIQVTHWLTDCPVCRMNLAGNTDKSDGLTVLHPVTLIYKALKQI
ncbi:MAG: (Fe-S)-binding protein [Desulfobacula sp.]